MIVTFDPSVTGQQRQWINDTIARSIYPWDNLPDAHVTFFAVTEPPCAGHKDLMCTTDEGGGNFHVHIRIGIDDPAGPLAQSFQNPARDIKVFFQETIMHELAHVAAFTYITDDILRTTVAGWFTRQQLGEGSPTGELADWDDLADPWEDRIQETVAEVIKDGALDPVHRIYDNRTNWAISEANYQSLIGIVAPGIPGDPGGTSGGHVDYEWDGLTLADQLSGTNTPTDGTSGLQTFPEQAGENGLSPFMAYLGPRASGHGSRIDLGAADTITLRIWLYAQYVGPPDFTVEQPTGHHFDLRIGAAGSELVTLSVRDTDLTWEEEAAQADWRVPEWHWRGYIDVDGRAINDYCVVNGESPVYQITRDFGTAYGGDGNITWDPWYPAGSTVHDHIVLEWLTTDSSGSTPDVPPGKFSYPYQPPTIHGVQGDGGVMRFTAR